MTTIMITTTAIDHHDHGGLKHYHDEDMQSSRSRPTSRSIPDKFFPWIQNLVQTEGPNILRSKGILSLQGRSRALRVPGRAHDPRRRSSARWKDGEKRARAASCSSAATCRRRRSARASRAAWRRPHPIDPSREAMTSGRALGSSTTTDAPDPLRRRSHQARRGGRAGRGRAFPRPTGGLRARRGGAAVRRAGRRRAAASRCTPAASCRRRATARASSPAATTARWSRPMRRAKARRVATDAKHRWIDHVALGPDGAIAWSAGKQAFVRTAKGEVKSLDLPSTVGGLAFAPKGLRLAIAHYNGVTLWFPNAQAAPEMLGLEGLASRRRVQPGRQVPGHRMQEPTLHGWRLVDGKDMRMSGYSAQGALVGLDRGRQVARDRRAPSSSSSGRSAARTARWASSRAWSCRTTSARSRSRATRSRRSWPPASRTAWCCWRGSRTAPRSWRRSRASAAVSALAWSDDGAKLAFGTEDGEAGVVDLA